ncbi:O-fucosyltransferase 37 [Impatiens glandulifera]|uniref:O-fucosyltransferase 37 n=1 Tax=Impatiens glandulifera TaxID=253017 RepID=UPI001FB17753|nr:O-fucosyltransferase 37 [Impatiens glandulifera]
MARTFKNYSFILNPSLFYHLISSSPFKKKTPRFHRHLISSSSSPPHLLPLLFISSLFFLIVIGFFIPISRNSDPCSLIPQSPYSENPMFLTSLLAMTSNVGNNHFSDEPTLSRTSMMPLPIRAVSIKNTTKDEAEFWKQPDGEGYKPCLEFGIEYRRESNRISKEKRRFLVVVVSGGLNQQRNQIIDAVVIARILEAALVIPVMQVNRIWGDDSEFSDMFDVEHFKKTLQADVRIVSSLPSSHLVSKQTVITQIPYGVPPIWIRARFSKQLKEEGLLVLKGLDSKLSKNLPSDLQKLRCKVAFHALRFSSPIRELGTKLANRMWIEGPYVAIHLRLEKDVWIRTGCLTGLGPKLDRIISNDRDSHPEFLTGRLNLSHIERRLSGLCPLNAHEVARLMKALGAPRNARVYIAGGEPFGGALAMKALFVEFPNLITKEMLAKEGELEPYANKSSAMAAIDYIVSLSSDVFLPSHGGNMARAMQGHRAYVGHRKFIRPNKRMMLPYFEDDEYISNPRFSSIIRKLHHRLLGEPELRTKARDRDVIAFPVPECMCKH